MRNRGWYEPEPEVAGLIGQRIADAIAALCHPEPPPGTSVQGMGALGLTGPAWHLCADLDQSQSFAETSSTDVDALVVRLFEEEGVRLVRLVRLVVDDRNAAEDIVQEGFIRLARSAGRINDQRKAASYLRSIVLNLARDQNRRGLVSLRHHLPFDDHRASTEDEIVVRDDQREVIEALRELPHRQRDCLVLRYYEELGIDDIADTLGISRNSVKTHLKRGLASMEQRLGLTRDEPATTEAQR